MQPPYDGDSKFEQYPRRQQEVRLRPAADRLYEFVWQDQLAMPVHRALPRYWDQKLGLDAVVRLKSGQILTIQEKFLSTNYAQEQTLTVEFEQNQHTGERGDWFHLFCQFYFCGYEAAGFPAFTSWILVDWPKLVMATAKGLVPWQERKNQNGRARASFRYVPFNQIPVDCRIAGRWFE